MGSAFLLLLATSGLLCGVVLSQITPPKTKTTTTKPQQHSTKWVKNTEQPTKHSSEFFWSSTRKAQVPKESKTEATTKTMEPTTMKTMEPTTMKTMEHTTMKTMEHTTSVPEHVTVSEKVQHLTTTMMDQPGGGGGSSSSLKDVCNETLEWQKDIDENIEKLKELVEILLNNSSTQPIKGPCIVKSTAVSYIDQKPLGLIGSILINDKLCVRCSSKSQPEHNLTPGIAICVFDPSTCLPIDNHVFNTGDSRAGAQGDFLEKYLDLISGDAAVAGISCGDFSTNLGEKATARLNALSLPLEGLKPNDKVTFVTKTTIPSKALMDSEPEPGTGGLPTLNSMYSVVGDTNKNFWFLRHNDTFSG